MKIRILIFFALIALRFSAQADTLTLKNHTNSVYGVAFSPNGQNVITGSYDGTAKIWDVQTGAEILTLSPKTSEIHAVAYSPDGQSVITSGGDGSAKIWSASTGDLLLTLQGHPFILFAVAFSPDGQRVITGSHDNTAKVWSAGLGEEIFTLAGHSDAVFSAKFSPDGSNIVTASGDGTVKIWSATTGKLLRTINAHSDAVFSVAFSPDGSKIATGSYDGTAKIWDFGSGTLLRTFTGFATYMYGVAFSPDGAKLMVGSSEKTARIFDITSGTLLETLKGHSENVVGVAFSPNADRLLTGSVDKTAKIWKADALPVRDTARTTVSLVNITGEAGSKQTLILSLSKQENMTLAGAPKAFKAKIRYNKTMVFNEQTRNACSFAYGNYCEMELSGVRGTTAVLASFPVVLTLGNSDVSALELVEFSWVDGAIFTETQRQNGAVRITGICEEGGVRLFIPGENFTSLAVRPNPAEKIISVHYGLREEVTLSLDLLDITGQIVQRIEQNRLRKAGEYIVNADLTTLPNGVYMLRLTTNREILTTRIDLVK